MYRGTRSLERKEIQFYLPFPLTFYAQATFTRSLHPWHGSELCWSILCHCSLLPILSIISSRHFPTFLSAYLPQEVLHTLFQLPNLLIFFFLSLLFLLLFSKIISFNLLSGGARGHKCLILEPQMSHISVDLSVTWSSVRCLCSWQGGWNWISFKVPSNPILWKQFMCRKARSDQLANWCISAISIN